MSKNTVRIRYVGDVDGLRRATRDAEAQVSMLGATGSRAFHALGRAAVIGGAAVAGGVALGLGKAVHSAIDFDREMRNVNSIARVSEKSFKGLETSVLGLAGETGQAPKTLAQGLYDIVSSGFKANAGIKILRVSAKAATAGMTDTATATKAVVASLNAYHQGASQATHAGDVLFQTVNKGVLTFAELSQNIGDVLPSASTLGVPLEEVGGALATITLHGVNASEAATQVKQEMISMLKPSKALKEELKSLGFESGQAAIKQLGFSGVIEKLSKAAGGNKAMIASWFPNVRALGGFFGLAGKNLQTFLQNVDAMGTRGALAKAFAEQGKSIAVQWQKAKAALTAAAIPLGNLVFPALSKAAGAAAHLARFIQRINEGPDIGAKLRISGAGIAAFAKDIRTAFSHALFTWDEILPAKPGGRQVEGSAQAIVTTLHTGILEQIQSLNWGAIGKKVGAGISAGIAFTDANLNRALGALLRWMNAHAQDFAEVGANIALHLVATLLDPAFWAHHWRLTAAIALTVFGGSIVKGIGLVGKAAASKFIALFEPIFARLAPRAVGLFLDAFSALPRAVQQIASNVGRFIYTEIASKLGKLKDWFGKVPGWIKAAFNVGVILTVVGAIQKVVDKIKDVWNWLTKITGHGWHIAVDVAAHVPGGSIGHKIKSLFNAEGGTVPMVPGAIRGVDSVAAMLTPGEVIFNPLRPSAGLQALMDLGFDRPEHFAAGGPVKKKHRAPRLPASIREAKARAAGTRTLDDDIAAATREEHWTSTELSRTDLTGSERESLRLERIHTRNRLASLRTRRATQRQNARQHDYSVLPDSIRLMISRARLSGDNAELLSALQYAVGWLWSQLGRHGLSAGQQASILDAIKGFQDEIDSLQGAGASQGQDPDLQAQLDQANRRLEAAQSGFNLDEAFIRSGGVGGRGNGGGGGGEGSEGGQHIHMSFLIPDEEQLRRATSAIARGAGTQPHRTATREFLGL